MFWQNGSPDVANYDGGESPLVKQLVEMMKEQSSRMDEFLRVQKEMKVKLAI